MKYSKAYIFIAGACIWSLAGCSSTNTENGNTITTTESISPNDPSAKARTEEMRGVTEENAATTSMDTTSFAAIAASNDIMEINLGNQAQTKATNPEVKKFAQQMVTDHTATSEELKGIASKTNMTLPDAPVPMHQRMMAKLSREEDADEYDEEYMNMQVLAHKQAVDLFEKAAKNENNPDLRAFASKNLPTLKMHLDMAKATKDKVH